MLVLPESMIELHDDMRSVLMDLRRGHVSKFPIHVKTYSTTIKFYDSRFMTGVDLDDALIAIFSRETNSKGKYVYTVYSHTIRNDKYRQTSREYHSKQSADPKKMLKVLRENVNPLSTARVAKNSKHQFSEHLTTWHHQTRNAYRRATESIDLEGIVEELMVMQQMGFKPQTAKLSRLMNDAVPAYQEWKRVKERGTIRLYVLVNPDGSVALADWDGKAAGFESLDTVHKNVQEQVAMLRMMDNGAFVPEIGLKVNDTQYWIEVDKNTLA